MAVKHEIIIIIIIRKKGVISERYYEFVWVVIATV